MATSKGSPSDLRTEFSTKEGSYRNVKASEHCRPSRQPLFGKELSPVHVSTVSCKDKDGLCEWILFNSGKELYFYPFEGVGQVPDLKRPLDKRVYRSPTVPVCHDFNLMTRSTAHLDLVVGFSTGPLQHLNPIERQSICAFNEDGSIDSTRVMCVKWVPGNDHQFVSAHRSGHLYIWNSGYSGKTSGLQSFAIHKDITDAKICTVKPKNKSPILYRWTVGHGAINEFAFSPDANHIAIASQDGFLRVYDFHKQEIYGRMRSYFGGLLCVCWSPDGKYAVTGGEDDLVTVWSFDQKRVVARGEGHKSYINAVAFDPYMTTLPQDIELVSPSSSIPPLRVYDESSNNCTAQSPTPNSSGNPTNPQPATTTTAKHDSPTLQTHSRSTLDSTAGASHHLSRYLSKAGTELEMDITAYRLGSVGQDTQLCLWDLSGDVLKPRRPFLRNRSQMSRHSRPVSMVDPAIDTSDPLTTTAGTAAVSKATTEEGTSGGAVTNNSSSSQPNGPGASDVTTTSGHTSKEPNRTTPSPAEDADSAVVGNHVDSSAKRTSLSSNRDSMAEMTPTDDQTTTSTTANATTGESASGVPTVLPDDGRSSTPSTMSISSEKGVGKKEKKTKKEKKSKQGTPKHTSNNNNKDGSPSISNDGEKYAAKKSTRKSLHKVIKFVSNIGGGNSHTQHSYRRGVAAFETCKSDDIAPKMSEVNLIEPLVAKKITSERLTALVFHRDCIITACQEGFINTWSRPDTELPPSEAAQQGNTKTQKDPTSSIPSNPGINSPKPGGGTDHEPLNSTPI